MKQVLKYPNGSMDRSTSINLYGHKDQGLDLEALIEQCLNEAYQQDRCWIVKYPTPIKVIQTKIIHGHTHISDGVFHTPSCCDYIGVIDGHAIALEAKSTIAKRFNLNLIKPHQYQHLRDMVHHGGYGYIILEMKAYGAFYLLDVALIDTLVSTGQKSLSIDELNHHAIRIDTHDPHHPLRLVETIHEVISHES